MAGIGIRNLTRIHYLIRSSLQGSVVLGTFLITSKASDHCKLSTSCEIPSTAGAPRSDEAYGTIRRKPAPVKAGGGAIAGNAA